jgi:hypothetical protein
VVNDDYETLEIQCIAKAQLECRHLKIKQGKLGLE